LFRKPGHAQAVNEALPSFEHNSIVAWRACTIPKPRPIAGRGCVGSDLKQACSKPTSRFGPHNLIRRARAYRTAGQAMGSASIRDTWGTAIVDDLKPEAADVVIYKNRFSGFYQTELDAVLKRAGIKHIIVTGCTTSVCVESTIRDAYFRDYHCVLLTDCSSEPPEFRDQVQHPPPI
jgi:nicotinamidase-related amidase